MQFSWLVGIHFILYAAAAIIFAVTLDYVLVAIGLGLIWISVVDCRRFEIPDSALAVVMVLAIYRIWDADLNFADHVLGGLIWPFLFWLVACIFRARRGVDGLGFGDIKLMSAIGTLAGFQLSVIIVFFAAASGIFALLVFAAVSPAEKGESGPHLTSTMLAFGPFLCFAAWVVLMGSMRWPL